MPRFPTIISGANHQKELVGVEISVVDLACRVEGTLEPLSNEFPTSVEDESRPRGRAYCGASTGTLEAEV